MGAARHSRHNLVSLACLFIVGVTPGCTIPHPPPIPADLSEARVAYGSNVLSKTRFARYPELNFITDLHYGRFGNGAEGELAVVGTSGAAFVGLQGPIHRTDRKSTRLNSSHSQISYAVFCLKKKTMKTLKVLQENP